jgi:enamine deaminase RidA (YjgF/YER057c/UK114 family)
MREILQPKGWPRPSGYLNGIAARGTQIFVGGQIGWTAEQVFETDDLVGQMKQALTNTLAVLAEAEAGPEHIVLMTWYLTDRREYNARLKEVGEAYRSVMGKVFAPMAVVEVSGLVEERARIEIQAIAVKPDPA